MSERDREERDGREREKTYSVKGKSRERGKEGAKRKKLILADMVKSGKREKAGATVEKAGKSCFFRSLVKRLRRVRRRPLWIKGKSGKWEKLVQSVKS